MADSDSIKLCECGCGQPAPIAKNSNRQFGHIKGHPVRFICGHHTKKHGYSKIAYGVNRPTPTYSSWSSMLHRCRNPNASDWHRYGGRGIRVCVRWQKFENFLTDMGERPSNTTIERRNNNGNYEPRNCRWATWKEQENNRRNNRLITFNGRTKTLQQWANELGMGSTTIDERLRRGWSVTRALTAPIRQPRLLTYNGQSLSVSAWASKLNLRKAMIEDRLRAGWSVERALSTPRGKTGPKTH